MCILMCKAASHKLHGAVKEEVHDVVQLEHEFVQSSCLNHGLSSMSKSEQVPKNCGLSTRIAIFEN